LLQEAGVIGDPGCDRRPRVHRVDRVPCGEAAHRRLFAASIYTYTRAAELEALEWEDVDLARRILHLHRAIDRSEDGKVKETKTNNPRRIPIEPGLVPLLEVMKAEATGRRVLNMPPACDLAPRLRQYLEWAGVKRAELREAENLEYPVGEVFPAVPPALLVSSAGSSEGPAYWAQLRGRTYKNVASPAGFEPA